MGPSSAKILSRSFPDSRGDGTVRYEVMGEFQSFAEVLEKKIRREIEAEILSEVDSWLEDSTASTSTQTTRLDNSPDCLSSLLGVVEPLRQNPQLKAHLYHRLRPAVRPQPKARPAHVLNERQLTALHFFKTAGSALENNYSLPELKTEFRKLALRFHPDRPQGSASHFIQLKAAYDNLRLVF